MDFKNSQHVYVSKKIKGLSDQADFLLKNTINVEEMEHDMIRTKLSSLETNEIASLEKVRSQYREQLILLFKEIHTTRELKLRRAELSFNIKQEKIKKNNTDTAKKLESLDEELVKEKNKIETEFQQMLADEINCLTKIYMDMKFANVIVSSGLSHKIKEYCTEQIKIRKNIIENKQKRILKLKKQNERIQKKILNPTEYSESSSVMTDGEIENLMEQNHEDDILCTDDIDEVVNSKREKEIENLMVEKQDTEEKLKNFETKYNTLHENHRNLKNYQTAIEDQLKEVKEQYQVSKAEAYDLTSLMNESKEEIQSLRNQNNELKEDMIIKDKLIKDLQNTVQILESDLETSNNNFVADNLKIEIELENLRNEKQINDAKIAEQTEIINNLNIKYDDDLKDFKTKNKQLLRDLQVKSESEKRMKESNDEKKKEIDSLHHSITTMKERLESRKIEKSRMDREIAKMEEEMYEMTSLITKAQEEFKNLKGQLEKNKTELQDSLIERQQLKSSLEAKQAELEALRRDVNLSETAVRVTREEAAAEASKARELAETIEKMKQEQQKKSSWFGF